MRLHALLVTISFAQSVMGTVAPNALSGKYDIHLYFGEKGFLDEMLLEADSTGKISGMMHVPNDFDSPIKHFTIKGTKFSFDYLVPKNTFRPNDFHANYEGYFYDASFQDFIGFGTVIEDQTLMASFLGHRIKSQNPSSIP